MAKYIVPVEVELVHTPHTDSIMLGYSIGSAELPHDRKLVVMASGKTLRFDIPGIDGYVDVDISEVAKQAAIILTGE